LSFKDDENVMEEEDTLVLRMEAMMLAEDQEDRLSFAVRLYINFLN